MSSYKWNRIPVNNCMVAIASLLASINVKSSVSVKDIVTVGCLDVFQSKRYNFLFRFLRINFGRRTLYYNLYCNIRS